MCRFFPPSLQRQIERENKVNPKIGSYFYTLHDSPLSPSFLSFLSLQPPLFCCLLLFHKLAKQINHLEIFKNNMNFKVTISKGTFNFLSSPNAVSMVKF